MKTDEEIDKLLREGLQEDLPASFTSSIMDTIQREEKIVDLAMRNLFTAQVPEKVGESFTNSLMKKVIAQESKKLKPIIGSWIWITGGVSLLTMFVVAFIQKGNKPIVDLPMTEQVKGIVGQITAFSTEHPIVYAIGIGLLGLLSIDALMRRKIVKAD